MVLEQEIALDEFLVLEYILGSLLTPSMTLKLLQLFAGELSVESSSPQGSYYSRCSWPQARLSSCIEAFAEYKAAPEVLARQSSSSL